MAFPGCLFWEPYISPEKPVTHLKIPNSVAADRITVAVRHEVLEEIGGEQPPRDGTGSCSD